MDYTDFENRARTIRDENGVSLNTAARIGGLFASLTSWFRKKRDSFCKESLAQIDRKATIDAANHTVDLAEGAVRERMFGEEVHAMFEAKAHKDLSNVEDGVLTPALLHEEVEALFAQKAALDLSNAEKGTLTERMLDSAVRKKLKWAEDAPDINNYYLKLQTDQKIHDVKTFCQESFELPYDTLYQELENKAWANTAYTREAFHQKLSFTSDAIVTNPFGGFSYGDNLKGLSLADVFRLLLTSDEDQVPQGMYFGYMTYEQAGLSPENCTRYSMANLTYEGVKKAKNSGSLRNTDVQNQGKTSLGVIPKYAFILVAVPYSARKVVTKDDGFGRKVAFDERYAANGVGVLWKNIRYSIYGGYTLIQGETYIYIDSKTQ